MLNKLIINRTVSYVKQMFGATKRLLFHIKVLPILLTFYFSFSPAHALEDPGTELARAGIDTKQGQVLDMELVFTTSNGESKKLKEIVDPNKPIIITPVYYDCPRLCGLLLNGFMKLTQEMDLKMGLDYQVLTISFDDTEQPSLAQKRANEYYTEAKLSPEQSNAWHFLVGNKENVTKLMSQIGFRYFKEDEEFAHSAVIIVLTPQGEISQYFTGIEFSPWDARLAIIEASQGKIGSLVDHILLFCFRYDHKQGKYTWAVSNFLKAGGTVTLLVLAYIIYWAARNRI